VQRLAATDADVAEQAVVEGEQGATLPLAVGLSVLTTAALTGFLIAPRVRGRTALAATLLALTLVVLIGGEIGVALLIPEWAVTEYVYETSRAQGGTTMNHWIVPAFPFSYLALSTLLCWAAWRWAKGRGEQWFRFEG